MSLSAAELRTSVPDEVHFLNSDPPISLDRFTWTHAFATRLKELGAPASMEELLTLGQELHESSADQDPIDIAEFVWRKWPTDHGELGLAEG